MQWNNYYLQLDPLDPLLLNDDETQTSHLNQAPISTLSNLNVNLNDTFKSILDPELNSNIVFNPHSISNTKVYTNDLIDNTSPLSSISTNTNSANHLESLDSLDNFESLDSLNDHFINIDTTNYTNKTINITELTKLNISLLENANNNNTTAVYLQPPSSSPILKSQATYKPAIPNANPIIRPLNNSLSLTNNVQSFEFNDLLNDISIRDSINYENSVVDDNNEENGDIQDDRDYFQESEIIEDIGTSDALELEQQQSEEGEDEDEDDSNPKSKKISDSRLSLAQLSIVLNLEGNDNETAKREKNILKILKDDLNFPIGEKTWIRDTPANERERIMTDLTSKVEQVYSYGYSKKTLAIIVRRASYYMMQGRLRRERRLQRRKKSLANKQSS